MAVPKLRFKDENGADYPDWEKKKLKEISTLLSSKRIHASDYVETGIAFFRGKEISCLKNKTHIEDVLYISENQYNDIKEKYGVPKRNDLLITAVGTLGNTWVVDTDEPFYFKDGNLIWLKDIGINTQFLNQVFTSPMGQSKILDSAVGSNQKALTIVKLSDVALMIPCNDEQNKIADFLTTFDKRITAQQNIIADMEETKKGLLQKIFSQEIRFKDENGEEYPAWKESVIGNFTEVGSGSRVHREQWVENGVRFYRSSDVMAFHNHTKNNMGEAFITLDLYEKLVKKSGKLEKDDILVTGGGSIGMPYIITDDEPIYTKDADLIWIKHKSIFDSRFIFYYFLSKQFKDYLKSISHIGTIAHYTISQVKNTPINLPIIEEQNKIASFLSAYDKKIEAEKKILADLQELKKGLLQQMFV